MGQGTPEDGPNVAPLARGRRKGKLSDEAWLRRQALQIAAQLPEKQDDALAVLSYAEELVLKFMSVTPV